MEVISDIIARLGISSCSSLSRALDNGRAIRRIVCAVVHNLRASHDYIRLDAFLEVGILVDNPSGISNRSCSSRYTWCEFTGILSRLPIINVKLNAEVLSAVFTLFTLDLIL